MTTRQMALRACTPVPGGGERARASALSDDGCKPEPLTASDHYVESSGKPLLTKALAGLGLGLAVLGAGQAIHTPPMEQAAPVTCEPTVDTACYENPVLTENVPDPGVIQVDGEYWLTNTGGNAQGTFPRYRSDDLVHWRPAGAIFTKGQEPAWANGSYWAPETHQVGDGYVTYFTAREKGGELVIGAATSPSIDGPFRDIGHPLIESDKMGLIDPTIFRDSDGTQFIYWKEDGNAVDKPSRIMVSRLSADGLELEGPRIEVLRNDRDWEGKVVEAPEIVKHGDHYYLFYSGNGYAGQGYAEGVARSKSPMGPFEKAPAPILRSNHDWKGPGHAAFTRDQDGQDWMVYHSWQRGNIGEEPGRVLMLDPIRWGEDGWPQVEGRSPSASAPTPAAIGG